MYLAEDVLRGVFIGIFDGEFQVAGQHGSNYCSLMEDGELVVDDLAHGLR